MHLLSYRINTLEETDWRAFGNLMYTSLKLNVIKPPVHSKLYHTHALAMAYLSIITG